MAVTKVVVKNSEIDGKPIIWNVLSITSFIDGEFRTLELKISKTEALLANMLLKNREEQPEKVARKATSEEEESFLNNNSGSNWLNELGGNNKQ